MPSNVTMSRPWCGRTASTVSVGGGRQRPSAAGPRAAPGSATSTDPGANRCAGSSVRTSTMTSPRMPCGRVIRPTTSIIGAARLVRVDDLDADAATADRGDDLAQGLGGAPTPADHRAQVFGVDTDLQ